jgi:hypothetical protein
MVPAGETVFVAGAPLVFDLKDPGATYAGRHPKEPSDRGVHHSRAR